MTSNNPYTSWGADDTFDDDLEGGAFAVDGEVTWEGGGDDDLAVPQPRRAPMARRPQAAGPTNPSPRPPLTGDTEEPEWARIRPREDSFPSSFPQYQTPQQQAVPQQPQRQLPTPDTEEPDWARIRPVEPAFGPVDDVDLDLPAGPEPEVPGNRRLPSAPARVEPTYEPAYEDSIPDFSKPQQSNAPAPAFNDEDDYGYEQPPAQPAPQRRTASAAPLPTPEPDPEPEPEDKPVKKLFGIPLPPAWQDDAPPPKKGGKKGAPTKTTPKKPGGTKAAAKKPGLSAGGGRLQVKAFRAMFWLVAAVLLLGGLKNVFVPHKDPNVNALTTQVSKALGKTNYPLSAAEGFAARFTQVYLTYDANNPTDRAAALGRYGPADMLSNTGWESQNGKQAVIDGPFVAQSPEIIDGHNAIITTASQVTGGQWLYLAVPVYAANADTLAVSGPPGFAPPPATAPKVPGVSAGSASNDEPLQSSLGHDTLPGFFTAWAASNGTDLQRYLTPNATAAARSGLGGSLQFSSISNSYVPVGGNIRKIYVNVEWATGTAGKYIQSYRLTVEKLSNGQWYVQDIRAAYVQDSSTDPGPLTGLTGS